MDPKHVHHKMKQVSINMSENNNNEEKTDPSIGGVVDISDEEENTVPEEEWDALAALLREAYPSPTPGSITQNVMDRIRAESAKTARRRQMQTWLRLRTHVRRYGGMAACVVLLCGVLFLVYPRLNQAVDMASGATDAEAVVETLAEIEAVEEPAVYSDQAVGFAMPRSAAVTEEAVEEKAEAEEANTETSAVQTYSATALLKSVSMYAAAEADVSDDAADDSSLADGFLHYLLSEGYFTTEEYQSWLAERGTETVWEPEELCEAFELDAAVYDAWLRK